MRIRSHSEAARELGVDRITVSDMVREGKIPIVRNPGNGNSKGLDEDAFLVLRQRLAGESRPCSGPTPRFHADARRIGMQYC